MNNILTLSLLFGVFSDAEATTTLTLSSQPPYYEGQELTATCSGENVPLPTIIVLQIVNPQDSRDLLLNKGCRYDTLSEPNRWVTQNGGGDLSGSFEPTDCDDNGDPNTDDSPSVTMKGTVHQSMKGQDMRCGVTYSAIQSSASANTLVTDVRGKRIDSPLYSLSLLEILKNCNMFLG